MSGSEEPVEELQANSNRLSEGLKTCRMVVENYRSLLAGQPAESFEPMIHRDALNDNAG